MYPDVRGVIVDKGSAKGIVVVYHHGFPVQQVDTGQEVMGEPYSELTVQDGQMCVVHGRSTVLYYNLRKGPPAPEITIRLQIDEAGKSSAPYVKPKIKTTAGDKVMRDGSTRDRVSSELGGVLCFEMEAAEITWQHLSNLDLLRPRF
jgi:hypothetical protein